MTAIGLTIAPAAPDLLPVWTEDAINLLKPALGVMARPVIINNLKRAAADPVHSTSEELHLFCEKVQHGIKTFASEGQAQTLTAQLRTLVLHRR